MVFYLFPRTFISYDKVGGRFSNETVLYSPSFFSYLQELKDKTKEISFFCHNPYIWLYTSTLNKTNASALCIANIHANDAGVYEFIEIVDLLRLTWDSNMINTYHMGPNARAMYQAIQYIRKKRSHGLRVFRDSHEIDLPLPNDLPNDLRTLYETKKQSFHLITADYTNEEDCEYNSCISAIKAICYSLCVQMKNGTYIMKMGDTASELSLDIVYFLSHFYEKTYFIKPSVNNITSSEKFMVCKGFLFEQLDDTILTMLDNLYYCTQIDLKLNRIFHDSIPLYFIGKIEEINSIFGQPRLEHMNYILSALETSKQNIFTSKQDIQKCVEWCSKYRVPMHDVWM
jgi:hypothetical protein